jgi:ABC-type molybdate transport system permease subunit
MPACFLLFPQKHLSTAFTIVPLSFPPRVLEYLLLLLLPWVGLHGALSPAFLAPLSCHLLGLLLGWAADGPVYLAEDVGFDR